MSRMLLSSQQLLQIVWLNIPVQERFEGFWTVNSPDMQFSCFETVGG